MSSMNTQHTHCSVGRLSGKPTSTTPWAQLPVVPVMVAVNMYRQLALRLSSVSSTSWVVAQSSIAKVAVDARQIRKLALLPFSAATKSTAMFPGLIKSESMTNVCASPARDTLRQGI